MSGWTAEGRTLGESLRRFTCVVVAGRDHDATADVALGIAEAQSAHRRVVVGDLLGDAPRFAPYRSDDDPHGLVDTFHYGISLGRISRRIEGAERLLFAPTGSEISSYPELLAHPRWPRLIASFAEANDLLVVAVPLDAGGLSDLVVRTDGVVIVDAMAPAQIDVDRIIATVRAPAGQPTRATSGTTAAAATPATRIPLLPSPTPANRASATARPAPVVTPRTAPSSAERKPRVQMTRSVVFGLTLTGIAALLMVWLASRPFDQSFGGSAQTINAVARSSGGAILTPAGPNSVDPADSGAAAYAVLIMSANTQAGAILKLREVERSLPAATYAPVMRQGTTWYKVLAGAFTTRGSADSLLADLRTNRVLDSTAGIVVKVPFALRIDSLDASPSVPDLLASLRGHGVPAYVLHQDDGTEWILVGAFENRSEADTYAQTLRAMQYPTQLVLRKGRMF